MITVQTTVSVPVENAWEFWNAPEHITKWNFASDDWECPTAVVDLRPGGAFAMRMQAKDGSAGFDFGGTFDVVELHKRIAYTLGDGRKVEVLFEDVGDGKTKVTEIFEPEKVNSEELQRGGWQSVLDNFRKYADANA